MSRTEVRGITLSIDPFKAQLRSAILCHHLNIGTTYFICYAIGPINNAESILTNYAPHEHQRECPLHEKNR